MGNGLVEFTWWTVNLLFAPLFETQIKTITTQSLYNSVSKFGTWTCVIVYTCASILLEPVNQWLHVHNDKKQKQTNKQTKTQNKTKQKTKQKTNKKKKTDISKKATNTKLSLC